VKVSVNECTAQLANNAEFVRVGSAWLRSRVPLIMFHVWDFPAVSTVQQQWIRTRLPQNVSFMSPQPQWIQQTN